MSNDTRSSLGNRRYLWEVLFSLNFAGAAVCVMFGLSRAASDFFSRFEARLKVFLHMRQTDLVVGHFATWIPTALLALLTWIVLRRTVASRFTTALARRAGGIFMITTPLIVQVCGYRTTYWMEWWRRGALVTEMVVAVALIWRIRPSQRNAFTVFGRLLLAAAHFAFWWFVAKEDPTGRGYGGPAGPILGFCGIVAWYRYTSLQQRVSPPMQGENEGK